MSLIGVVWCGVVWCVVLCCVVLYCVPAAVWCCVVVVCGLACEAQCSRCVWCAWVQDVQWGLFQLCPHIVMCCDHSQCFLCGSDGCVMKITGRDVKLFLNFFFVCVMILMVQQDTISIGVVQTLPVDGIVACVLGPFGVCTREQQVTACHPHNRSYNSDGQG